MRRFFTNLAALTLFWLSIVAAQSTQPFTLNASDGVPLDRFGTAVSIDGDFAIVGAPGHTDNGAESGAAYIFRNDVTTWTEIAKLTASDGTALATNLVLALPYRATMQLSGPERKMMSVPTLVRFMYFKGRATPGRRPLSSWVAW